MGIGLLKSIQDQGKGSFKYRVEDLKVPGFVMCLKWERLTIEKSLFQMALTKLLGFFIKINLIKT